MSVGAALLLLSASAAGSAGPDAAELARALAPHENAALDPADVVMLGCTAFDEEPTEFECRWRKRGVGAGQGWQAILAVDGGGWSVIDGPIETFEVGVLDVGLSDGQNVLVTGTIQGCKGSHFCKLAGVLQDPSGGVTLVERGMELGEGELADEIRANSGAIAELLVRVSGHCAEEICADDAVELFPILLMQVLVPAP